MAFQVLKLQNAILHVKSNNNQSIWLNVHLDFGRANSISNELNIKILYVFYKYIGPFNSKLKLLTPALCAQIYIYSYIPASWFWGKTILLECNFQITLAGRSPPTSR